MKNERAKMATSGRRPSLEMLITATLDPFHRPAPAPKVIYEHNEYTCYSDDEYYPTEAPKKKKSKKTKPPAAAANNDNNSDNTLSRHGADYSRNQGRRGSGELLAEMGRLLVSKPAENIKFMRRPTQLRVMAAHNDDFSELLRLRQPVESYLARLEHQMAVTVVNQRVTVELGGTTEQFTPLGLAIVQNSEDMVRTLLRYGADANAQPNTVRYSSTSSYLNGPLDLAALFGCPLGIITALMSHGAHMSDDVLLFYVAGCPDAGLVQRLLDQLGESQLDVTLHKASEKGNVNAVRELLKHGARPDARVLGKSALAAAAKANKPEVLRLLLQHNADVHQVDALSRTPLHFAVRFCKRKSLEMLLAGGADVNAVDANRNSVLSFIIDDSAGKMFRKDLEEDAGTLIGLLIQHGELNVASGDEFLRALRILLYSDVTDAIVLRWMRRHAAHVRRCHENESLLHMAVKNGRHEVAEWLLLNGTSDVSESDENGWLVVHNAANNRQMLELIVRHGGDVNSTTPQGLSALWLLLYYGLADMVSQCVRDGSDINGAVKVADLLLLPGKPNPGTTTSAKTAAIQHQHGRSDRSSIIIADADEVDAAVVDVTALSVETFNLLPSTPNRKLQQAQRNQRRVTLIEFALRVNQYKLAHDLYMAGAPLYAANGSQYDHMAALVADKLAKDNNSTWLRELRCQIGQPRSLMNTACLQIRQTMQHGIRQKSRKLSIPTACSKLIALQQLACETC